MLGLIPAKKQKRVKKAPRLLVAPWQRDGSSGLWEHRGIRAWVEGDGVIRGAAAARAGEA